MIQTRSVASTGIALVLAGLALAVVLLPGAILPAKKSASADAPVHQAIFDKQSFWQTTKVYCDTCHFGPNPRAKLNLEALDFAHLDVNGEAWEKVLRKLRSREMPPVGMPRPSPATYEALVKQIETERDRVAETRPNPGRPTLHRLNRTEYTNAIRDLLALDVDVSELLPPDDAGYGFDNIGDVLKVSPLLLERH